MALSVSPAARQLSQRESQGGDAPAMALPEGEPSRFFDTLDSLAIWPGNFYVFGESLRTVHVDRGKPEHSRYNNAADL